MSHHPHLEFSIRRTALIEDSIRLTTMLFPDYREEDLAGKEMTDGITNSIVRCTHRPSGHNVLVRIFGVNTEQIIDRHKEQDSFALLHSHGLAPDVYGTFQNGFACGYFPGVACTSSQVSQPHIAPKIAKRMAMFHKVPTDGSIRQASVFADINSFLSKIPAAFTDAAKHKRFQELIDLPKIESETRTLQHILAPHEADVVLCHNDLLCKNIIFDESGDGAIFFIDYEYARCNNAAYDIGNHFNEHAGVEVVDYSLYPQKPFQEAFLRAYLAEFNGIEPAAVTEASIAHMYTLVNKYALASHLLWGTWAVFQAENSTIDFDFLGYAKMRFDEYYRRKPEFLAL